MLESDSTSYRSCTCEFICKGVPIHTQKYLAEHKCDMMHYNTFVDVRSSLVFVTKMQDLLNSEIINAIKVVSVAWSGVIDEVAKSVGN